MSPDFYSIIKEESTKPFEFGTNDCALFVNTVYKRAFGVDLAGDIPGTYNDEYHAKRTLAKLGGWDGILLPKGFRKTNNVSIKRGDIVICDGAAGVYLGDCKAVFAGGVFRHKKEIETVYTRG